MAHTRSARRISFAQIPLILYSLLSVAIEWGLFFYWFGMANRYEIFLYGHLGAQPFDDRTVSRYWMAGLVAAGVVSVEYGALNWFVARWMGTFRKKYTPPNWMSVWLLSILPVGAGVAWITATQNFPVLPLPMALRVATIAVFALAPALAVGAEMAFPSWETFGTFVAAGGVIPIVLLLRTVELPAAGILSTNQAMLMASGGVIFGAIWLVAMTLIFKQRHIPLPRENIILFGGYLVYEILPLAHYLYLTPAPYHYITVTDNFFAKSWVIQGISWLIAIGITAGTAYIPNLWQRIGRKDGIERTNAVNYR